MNIMAHPLGRFKTSLPSSLGMVALARLGGLHRKYVERIGIVTFVPPNC
jgi:hypothetical protein